jgi:hypothetical protein
MHSNCRQRAPEKRFRQDPVMSAQHVTTKTNEYYDHIALFYLETRRCRYQWIIFACFYLYVAVVIFVDYPDMDKMMDINNDKC